MSENGSTPDGPTPSPEASGDGMMAVRIEKKVVYEPRLTSTEPMPDGGVGIGHVVIEGGAPVEHVYLLDAVEKRELLKQLSGGLELPA